MQSTGLIYAFHGHDQALLGFNIDLIPKFSLALGLFMVAIMTAGTAFVMWLAELITQRGIGQGMSLLIFANVVAGIPSGGHAVLDEGGPVKFVILLLVSIALLVFIVFMDNGQRRIPVTFARRVVGRKEMGRQLDLHSVQGQPVRGYPDHLRLVGALHPDPLEQHRAVGELHATSWNDLAARRPASSTSSTDFVLILAFTFFYVYIAFEPHQQAEMLRQQGGFVPVSVRACRPRSTSPGCSRASRGGGLLPGLGGRRAEHPDGAVEHQPLPLLRHHLADRGGCGP